MEGLKQRTQITLELARRLVLNAQLFGSRMKLSKGKEGIAQTIEKLGYIQIDPLTVIKRSHHHTLWTRRSDYEEKMLHELQVKDRRVFEYWGHAHSYLPMSDYRYHLPRMRNFDNLIIQRERTKHIFRFDYSLECYVPEARRKYGYFVLPVLWGENFVGRLDPKNNRKKKTLIIHNLVFEEHFVDFDDFLPSFADKLGDFARFNQCVNIKLGKVSPQKIKIILESLVKR